MPWLGHACGECRYCVDGRENLCESQYNNGYAVDGGYAEYMLADARFAVPVPDGITERSTPRRSPAPESRPTRRSRTRMSRRARRSRSSVSGGSGTLRCSTPAWWRQGHRGGHHRRETRPGIRAGCRPRRERRRRRSGRCDRRSRWCRRRRRPRGRARGLRPGVPLSEPRRQARAGIPPRRWGAHVPIFDTVLKGSASSAPSSGPGRIWPRSSTFTPPDGRGSSPSPVNWTRSTHPSTRCWRGTVPARLVFQYHTADVVPTHDGTAASL